MLSAPLGAGDYLRRAGGAAYDLRLGQLYWLASVAVYFLTVVLVWAPVNGVGSDLFGWELGQS